MLSLRIISALLGIPLLIWLIYQGGIWLTIALFLLVVIGTGELAEMLKKKDNQPLILPVLAGEFVFIFGAWLKWENWFSLGLGLCFLLLIIYLFSKFPNISVTQLSLSFFILIYVGWTLTHLILLRNLPRGDLLLFFLFTVIWSTDTGAYFSGRFLGKKKLAEKISPNKTREGAVGGLLLSILTVLIFNYYFTLFNVPTIVFLCLIISVIGQIGDLLESSFKRILGVKDSGNIIPGHGGMLDRFDSTITTAPVLFYLILFLDKLG